MTNQNLSTQTATRPRFEHAVDRFLFLRTQPLFRKLDDPSLRKLAQRSAERSFSVGQPLFSTDHAPEAMLILVEGSVSLLSNGQAYSSRSAPGRLGFPWLITGQVLSAMATEDCLTLAIPGRRFLELVEDGFGFVLAALHELCAAVNLAQIRRSKRNMTPADTAEPGPKIPDPLGPIDRLLHLRKGPYTQVNIEALMQIARMAREVRWAPGETCWREGEVADHHMHIASGVVRCTSAAGREFRFGHGGTLGYFDANSSRVRAYTAVAETEVVALLSFTEDYHDVLEDYPHMGMALLSYIAGRLLHLTKPPQHETGPNS